MPLLSASRNKHFPMRPKPLMPIDGGSQGDAGGQQGGFCGTGPEEHAVALGTDIAPNKLSNLGPHAHLAALATTSDVFLNIF